jgi:ferric-dicitrate binding protein FerR (iron transport regulator)
VSKVENRSQAADAHRALTGLITSARDQLGGEMSAREDAGLMRFEQAVARRTLRADRRPVMWALGFGAVAAGIALYAVNNGAHDSALTFNVVNGRVSDGGYVRAAASGDTEVRFSDGSSLALDPGTSTRVTDVDAHGGRVLLESGRAHVRVTHRPAAKWVVDAGPYSVHVVGTEFDVRWSGSEEVLDVHLHRGAVIVRGPLASGGLAMEAGQRLVANVKEGEIFLDADPARAAESAAALLAEPGEAPQPVQPSKIEPPAAAPAPAHHTSRSRAGALHVAPTAATDEASWSKLIAQGDFRGVLSDAERRGLERTLTAGSPADLTALADAARYLRRGDLARRAYLAERERFPRSAGREAAFFLGGLSEDESGVTARKTALEWYERYLSESPRGTYVPQALGRQMVLVHKLRGVAAARPLATEYLARFPDGPYAVSARKLTEAE